MNPLSNRYYLLTNDPERNRDAAEKFAEVLGVPVSKDFSFTAYIFFPYLMVNIFNEVDNDMVGWNKTPITYEELCEVHREWRVKKNLEIMEYAFGQTEDGVSELLSEVMELLRESAKVMSGGNGFATPEFLSRIEQALGRIEKHGR